MFSDQGLAFKQLSPGGLETTEETKHAVSHHCICTIYRFLEVHILYTSTSHKKILIRQVSCFSLDRKNCPTSSFQAPYNFLTRQLYVPMTVATSCPILGDADSYVIALKVSTKTVSSIKITIKSLIMMLKKLTLKNLIVMIISVNNLCD